MSAMEAGAFKIPVTDRGLYVRLDPANTNIAARSGPTWFRLLGVAAIGNGPEGHPNGGVVEPGSHTWEDAAPREPRKMLSEEQVLALVPFGRTTLYALIKNGAFPRGTYISPNRRFWFGDEIARWQDAIAETNVHFNPNRGRGKGRRARDAASNDEPAAP